MILVKVLKKGQKYCSLECSGHAEYDEAGKDIVCAAVSTLVINTLNSMEKFTEDSFGCESQESGYIYATFTELSHDSVLLMDSLILGLTEIAKEYSKYFKLQIKEV